MARLANTARCWSTARVRHHSAAPYAADTAAVTRVVLAGPNLATWFASVPVNAARLTVDNSHKTLRSRLKAGSPVARTAPPPAPRATHATAANVSTAPVDRLGQRSLAI